MKLTIGKHENKFYIMVLYDPNIWSYSMAIESIVNLVGISKKMYIDILENNGAKYNYKSEDYYFECKEDIKKVLEILEPYVIMAILTGQFTI